VERQADPATVLVVDDEPLVRRLVGWVLAEVGYHVLTAGGGAEALRLLTAHPGPFDLLLTDVDMPGMDGQALWAEAGPLQPGLPVLFMSGRPRPNLPGPLLLKPFSPEGLAAEVAAALGEGP
jgi:CheY-like chemotaxis protein